MSCADEVEWLLAEYRPDRLWFADDVFTIHHGWLREFAAILAERRIQLPFETITRADRMMDPEIVKTLAVMGCQRLWIGAESGSRRLLEAMQRGVTPEQVVRAASMARAHGIEIGLFIMWGYESEEFADIEATVEMVRDARPDIFFTTMAYPIKGTGYWNKVNDRIVNPKSWAETSDRENQVRGRPDRSYYRLADDWLRAAVREVDQESRLLTSDPSKATALAKSVAAARTRLLEARHGGVNR